MKITILILIAVVMSACALSRNRGEAVRERITEINDIAAHNISIDEDRYGNIILNGTVSSEEDRATVEKVARNTSGVSNVHSNLVVEGSSVAVRDSYSVPNDADRLILSDVRSNMLSSSQLRDYNIDVEVAESIVTLRGEVGTEREREAAESIARNTRGVTRVSNQLTIDRHRYINNYRQR